MPDNSRSVIRRTFYSLRTRNFRLFFIGQSISNSGNWLTNVALTLLILHLTHSGLYVGLLAACQFGPILLLSLWGGAIADRSDKRQLLFITQGLEMAESVALAALAFMHDPPVSALFAVATVGGVLLAFDNPLRRSFVTEMVPAPDIPNAVVLYSTVVNVARIVGPALAGALILSIGYGWCFAVDAASYLAVLTSLWMMRPRELYRAKAKARKSIRGEIREGFRYVLSRPVLWITFAMLLIIGSLAYNFTVTLPLFVTRSLHGDEATFTLIYSTFGFGSLIGALIVANRRLVRVRHIIIASAALGVNMLVLSVSPTIALTVPAAFTLGVTSIIYMTDHIHSPGRSRTDHAWPRAGTAVRPADRHDADRRPAVRGPGRYRGSEGTHRPRWHGLPGGGHVRLYRAKAGDETALVPGWIILYHVM